MRGKRLPDLRALGRHLEGMRVGATLRGVETTVEGQVIAGKNGAPLLRIAGTGEVVRLAPLRRTIQWDVAANRERPATSEERAAYARLRAQPPSFLIAITGPLTESADGDPPGPALEVRRYSSAPAPAGSAPFKGERTCTARPPSGGSPPPSPR